MPLFIKLLTIVYNCNIHVPLVTGKIINYVENICHVQHMQHWTSDLELMTRYTEQRDV